MSRGDIIRISVEGRELEHMPMDHPRGSRSQGETPRFLGANAPSQSCPHWQLWGRDFEMAFPSALPTSPRLQQKRSWPPRVLSAQKSTPDRASLQKDGAGTGLERVARFLKYLIAKLIFNRVYIDILDTIK